MKKILSGLILATLLGSLAFTVASTDPITIGADLPKAAVKMQDVSGKMISIKDAAKANGVLVMFSCNTCPYVLKNQDRTVEIAAYALQKDLGVIVLNSNEAYRTKDDSFEAMKAYAKDQKYKWSYVVDKNHEIADAFGANRTPEVFMFDKNMKLVYHGAIDDNPSDATAVNRSHLKMAINELTEGKEISVKESKSVGCSIKRNK
jgi:thioredoxin-related protein